MNKKIILFGTCLFVLACLFPYKTGVIYTDYGMENINVDGFYFFLQDKEERQYTEEVCGEYSGSYYNRTCLWNKIELKKKQTRLTTEKDKLMIELIAIVFGTLGLAFALGNKSKKKK